MAVQAQERRRTQPLIPFDVVDPPTQRLYVSAIVIALNAWKMFDWFKLMQDDTESVWLFLKWTAIDGVIAFNIPILHIPWLQWSFTLSTALFLLTSVLNGILMFRVAVPSEIILIALSKMLFDQELAVSEKNVKASSIFQNSSLILGKQIIHILPEGSAVLNPDRYPFCLGHNAQTVELPIRINQTNPVLLELLRIDPDTYENETFTIGKKDLKKLKNKASKTAGKRDTSDPLTLLLPVKKAGIYRLRKVLDESNLEVRRKQLDTYVTRCPRAKFRHSLSDKCFGELSDLHIEVEGVPPMKIRYSRIVNGKDRGFSLQSIHPESLISKALPVDDRDISGSVITVPSTGVQQILVPVNETLSIHGDWLYSINEVHDGQGNMANFTALDGSHSSSKARLSDLDKHLLVHERPGLTLEISDPQSPMKLPFGKTARLPLNFEHPDGRPFDKSYSLSYLFTPLERLGQGNEQGTGSRLEKLTLKSGRDLPLIKDPGSYLLQNFSSPFCTGKIKEPSILMLINPPEPTLSIEHENIYDKCAGNSIGIMANLDLIGTPPFMIYYDIVRTETNSIQQRRAVAPLLKHQIELRPDEAGHYIYTFKSIDDDIYKGNRLKGSDFVLEQDVRPPASAHFVGLNRLKNACIGQSPSFDILLQGGGPWNLEYEVVRGGKRKKFRTDSIQNEKHTIQMEPLSEGGEYILSLASIQDRSGCKIHLREEARIEVRRQHPKASFGELDGLLSVLTTKTKDKRVQLPLKLGGEAPWRVSYRKAHQSPPAPLHEVEVWNQNGFIEVDSDGTYELVEVRDGSCPGVVDSEKTFDVAWIARPQLGLAESSVITKTKVGYAKRDVCLGDEDSVEVNLSGTAPYQIKYKRRLTPVTGPKSATDKTLTVGLGKVSIHMETSKAGLYEYDFFELGDYLYDHDPKAHERLLLTQRVHDNPTAEFSQLGKVYQYCKEETYSHDYIPITLKGQPPFELDIAVKHHTSSRPELIHIPNIETNHYDFLIPDRLLALGNHVVTLRKVRDAYGCQRKSDGNVPKIYVTVSDVPSIEAIESRTDFCVGDRIGFSLSGTPPFSVYYDFNGSGRHGGSATTVFRRLAESPGNFTIHGISDGSSNCKASISLTNIIHPLPSVKISKGETATVDIHEGAEVDIHFEFGGTPPFEFTYTRSTNEQRGAKPKVLETKREKSYEYSMVVKASQEGTYEVIEIRDRYCGVSSHRVVGKKASKMIENT
ncbi:MAG: hypothetical protein M1814_002527 [Vezdaea aestivalis]|nr:MAG: hypothetical protein M1814_002527 [Vezdaea aestivalis]